MKKILSLFAIFFVFSKNISVAQCSSVFSDGFESGSYSPAWTTSLSDFSVTAGAAAVGNYKIVSTGASSHLAGISATIPSSTPTQVSWYIYPQGNAFATNYFVLGNNSSTATDCMVFSHWYNSPMGIRFLGTGSATFNYPATTDQWYFIELKNINYVTKTFDIYINGNLQQTAFAFRSTTLSDITKIHLYNVFQSTATWDEIKIGDGMLLTANTTSISCYGAATGASSITVNGVAGPNTYSWTGSASTSSVASGLTAGIYTVSVTNGTCVATQSINVTQASSLTTSFTQTNVTCVEAGMASVVASGATPPYSYSWTPGTSTVSVANNLTAGTYTCIIKDAENCDNVRTVTITSNTIAPTLTVTTSNSTICIGQSTNLSALGADTYSWSTGATTNSISVSPTVTTNYNVIGTNNTNGCSSSNTLSVDVSQCTGIETIDALNGSVSIYPNPFNDVFYLKVLETSKVIVCNVLGEVVFESEVSIGIHTIDLHAKSNGIYIVKVINNGKQQNVSIVKY